MAHRKTSHLLPKIVSYINRLSRNLRRRETTKTASIINENITAFRERKQQRGGLPQR
jgi:hypothetical protein